MDLRSVLPVCLIAFAMSGPSLANQDASAKKSMAGHSAGSMELHGLMAKCHHMAMPMSGEVDKDFATMMTMHHQQAIDMADVLIRTGKSPELKAMAQKMKTDQQAEIKQLAKFAGPMNHGGMKMGMDHGKMGHDKMDHGKMTHGNMDHSKMAMTQFESLDANKDGKIAKGEVPSAHPLSQHFTMLDTNKDGSVSRAEFDKHHGM